MLPLVFAAANAGAGAAAVPTGDTTTPINVLSAAHEHRSGIVMGFDYGLSLGSASGYPNNSLEIGDPAYYSATGLAAGTYFSLFIMGAFSDYVTAGFWFGHRSMGNADWRTSGDGGGLRIEGFPLVALVPRLQGLGVLAQLGIGSGRLDATKVPGESNGTQSFGGLGLFHEWSFGHVAGGHFAIGPSLEYDAIWSRPFEQHGLVATGRLVWYGGP